MNVFILNTGRCGSTTFIKACEHFSNYTASHESRISHLGPDRLNYPENHIEADNRLSWFLGRLDECYGDRAFYVHLLRNERDTSKSFSKRTDFGIMKAYREGIYLHNDSDNNESFSNDYIHTVNSNISLFLRDKRHKMVFRLEHANDDFMKFCQAINAEGNIDAALAEWNINYNKS